MNKKFLSAILFGALMVTSAGTFVSCSDDYDDDIKNLQEQITTNANAIKTLQDLIGQGNWVTGVTATEDGIRVTMSNGSTTDIKNVNGADGKDGTVVTIVDGYWAFDGVKSEYPATPGSSSDGQDAHEIKIEDGYWSIWNSEKGAYEKTPYAVAPISANQDTKGAWTIYVKNTDGTTSEIVLPATSLLSVEVVNRQSLDDWSRICMNYNYGIVREDKKWGWNEDKVMTAGFYSKLSDNMTLLLNPAGVHGDAYTYTLKNSSRDYATPPTEIQFFDTAVPYTGAALARTTSDNALWTLPAHVNVRPASEIEKIRRELYLFFKYNDNKYYNLAVEATSADGVKVISSYSTNVYPQSITGGETLSSIGEVESLIKEKYYPTFTGSAAGMIADYELRLSQSAENLKRADVYGATVTDNGHAWTATEDAGIYNPVSYDIMYILLDGSVKKIENFVTVNFTSKLTEIKDAWTLEDPTLYQGAPLNAAWNKDRGVFEYVTEDGKNYKEYDLTEFVDALDNTQKLVWNHAVEQLAKGNKTAFSEELIGGDGENNASQNNKDVKNNISYTIDKNKIRFTFSVSPAYSANFQLNKAYQYTITVVDPDNHGAGVAKIVLPFEFTRPDIAKVGIGHRNGEFTLWGIDTDDDGNKTGDVLYIFGAYDSNKMYLPFYEAFNMWNKEFSDKNENARYYSLQYLYPYADLPALTSFLGSVNSDRRDLYNNVSYQGDWTKYTTVVDKTDGIMARALNNDANGAASVNVWADYKFYGVYSANEGELGYSVTPAGERMNGFRLEFASTIRHSTMLPKEKLYYANANTNDVFISNDDITATTKLGGDFVLFDGLVNGVETDRATLNKARGFNESQRPFVAPVNYEISAKYVNDPDKGVSVEPIDVATAGWNAPTTKGELSYKIPDAKDDAKIRIFLIKAKSESTDTSVTPTLNVAGHTAGFAVQLGNNIDDRQPIEITIKVRDALGFYQLLKFNVQKLQ